VETDTPRLKKLEPKWPQGSGFAKRRARRFGIAWIDNLLIRQGAVNFREFIGSRPTGAIILLHNIATVEWIRTQSECHAGLIEWGCIFPGK